MLADLEPPDIEISEAITPEEQERLRVGTRTPRPYHHDRKELQHDEGDGCGTHGPIDGDIASQEWVDEQIQDDSYYGPGRQVSIGGSESGTEADDERPSFVKTLPAPHLRPRKGLRVGETNEDSLLTPSQLDDEGRRLSQDYFGQTPREKAVSDEEEKEEQEKLLRRRLAEFARRSSEVGVMLIIVLCVLCGSGVPQKVFEWRRELLTHVVIVAVLILAYPVKLSIVDSQSQVRKLWHRFRVPASFDPATVLYPPLLPVLVALSLSPADPAIVLPNIILGLSSLPQRLFPRSSRLGDTNVLHWFVSIIPLIAAENTAWPSRDQPTIPYMLKVSPSQGLSPETLVIVPIAPRFATTIALSHNLEPSYLRAPSAVSRTDQLATSGLNATNGHTQGMYVGWRPHTVHLLRKHP